MIKFLITFLIIFFLMRLLLPHLLRWALKAFVKKTIRNGTFVNANDLFNAPPKNQPEGQVRVDYVPEEPKKETKDFPGGEYVDYEEVK